MPISTILLALLFTTALLSENALLVLSKTDQTLSIVDPATLKVVAHMPSGPDPHEVIASTDGKYAYISNYGSGAYNTISVVDLVAHKTVSTIDLGVLHGPHGLVYVGGRVWFTAEADKVIGSYDPAANKVDWVLGTGQNRTHMIYVSDDLAHIITSNVSSATVSFIDKTTRTGGPRGAPQTDWNQTVVPVGRGSEGFDVSPDGKELWVANSGDGTISVIDVASRKVTDTLAASVKGANRLKFTTDGKLVFVSMLGSSDLAILNAATRKDVKRVAIGHGAAGILMQPDGARAFVSCTPDNYVTVIDLKSLEISGHIDAGKQPDGLAWAVRN